MCEKQSWNSSVLMMFRNKCGKANETTCSESDSSLKAALYQGHPIKFDERHAVYALLVCDCENAIAPLSRLNPNKVEKVYRLIRAYLYGARRYINFSFADAPYKFGDVATKTMSNLPIWRSFLKTGAFFI